MSDNKGSDTDGPERRQRIPDLAAPQPFENLLSQIVSRIKDQLFLFAIAAIVLIVAAIVLGTGLGSSLLQFAIAIIALVALATIVVGFALRRDPRPRRSQLPKQEAVARGGGSKITGSRAAMESPVGSQSLVAEGEKSSIRDVELISGAIPPRDRTESGGN